MANNPNVLANLKPFKKGEGGRPKGTKNKATEAWHLLKDDIINVHTERFNSVLMSLDNDKFIDTYLKILEYFKPKLARNENVNENYNAQLVTINIPQAGNVGGFPSNIVEEAEVLEELPAADGVGEGFLNTGLTGNFNPEAVNAQNDSCT